MTPRPRSGALVVVGAAVGVACGLALAFLFLRSLFAPPEAVSAPAVSVATPDASADAVAKGGLPTRAPAVPQAPVTRGSSASRPQHARVLDVEQTVYPALTSIYDWPREPSAPDSVVDRTFIEALVVMCGPFADRDVRGWYGPFLLAAAREFDADPFLLAALMFRISGCAQHPSGARLGLSGIAMGLYRDSVQSGALRFTSFTSGHWQSQTLNIGRFPFERAFLQSPESNLYFAAAFLRSWSEQAAGLRAAFKQPSEYRHYVSHFVWGDVVQSHREEDYILADRRRMLEYYGSARPRPPVHWRGFELGCPLDGCPRVVTSLLGDSRANGARVHAGNDFESTRGEPVRAVADGTVIFAGVDLPGRGAASRIPIWAQRNVDPSEMGAGGLYVCIDHGESKERESLISCYMHLERATVVQDRRIARGEQIGIVGTTGIKESRPHLHFELHSSAGVHNAAEILKGLVVGQPAARPPITPQEVAAGHTDAAIASP